MYHSPMATASYRVAKVLALHMGQKNCQGFCGPGGMKGKRKSVGQFSLDPDNKLCDQCFKRKPRAG